MRVFSRNVLRRKAMIFVDYQRPGNIRPSNCWAQLARIVQENRHDRRGCRSSGLKLCADESHLKWRKFPKTGFDEAYM